MENIGSRYDWAYRYEPSPHVAGRSIPLSLGKVLGGSGSINGMVWARGHRADYDGWAEAGNAGWDFNSVLPLFKKSEDWEDGASEFRGAGGPIRVERARDLHPVAAAFIDAGRSCGMPYLDDLNVPEPEGVGPMNLNVKGGTRCSPAGAYLRPVMGNKNLTVLTEAQAVKLTFTGTRCTGVDFLLDGRAAFRRRVPRGDPVRRGDPHAAPALAVRHRSAGRPRATRHRHRRRSPGRGAKPPGPRVDTGPLLRGEAPTARPESTISQAAPASGRAGRRSTGRT